MALADIHTNRHTHTQSEYYNPRVHARRAYKLYSKLCTVGAACLGSEYHYLA